MEPKDAGCLEDELGLEQMRLAACGIVAMANTPETAKEARRIQPEYMSTACECVADAVDREMTYRHALEVLRKSLWDDSNVGLADYIDTVLTPRLSAGERWLGKATRISCPLEKWP